MEIITHGTPAKLAWCVGCQDHGEGVQETRIPFRSLNRTPHTYFLDLCRRCRGKLEQAPPLIRDEGIVNRTWGQVVAALSAS